ncbi:unnamed protein product [Adineta ricciae]|uniref:Uncharacterized protein n=1 Tax=Adineta ricciae TaxID=249248 RepID=A0A814PSF1_ADIRI|nr:unnamed protein product [Adineta ricciae]
MPKLFSCFSINTKKGNSTSSNNPTRTYQTQAASQPINNDHGFVSGARFVAHEPSDSLSPDSDIFQSRFAQHVNVPDPLFSTLSRQPAVNHNNIYRSNINSPSKLGRFHHHERDISIVINGCQIPQHSQQYAKITELLGDADEDGIGKITPDALKAIVNYLLSPEYTEQQAHDTNDGFTVSLLE